MPALVIPALIWMVLADLHGGGLEILAQFLVAAVQPSLEVSVLTQQLHGLQITVLTALIAWSLSGLIGALLGLLSSRTVWSLMSGSTWPSGWFRTLLAPLRSLHELVWGLLLLQIGGLSSWVAVLAITLPYSALMARVVADQIDNRSTPALTALRCCGAGPIATLLSALLPAVGPTLADHLSLRLECALRSSLLLGVFGLGGLGTDLELSLRSLQFHELWSGLWLLAIVMAALEIVTTRWRPGWIGWLLLISPWLAIGLGPLLGLDFSAPQWTLPVTGASWSSSLRDMASAIGRAPWLDLVSSTIWLTLLSSAVAIGGPPLGLMLWPSRTGVILNRGCWGLLRLIPAPLTALLLLLLATPSLNLAALALGLHHLGVMGRVLQNELDRQNHNVRTAMDAAGASARMAWLYGDLAGISRRYLAYAAYRADVILRDTAVLGLVGGAGLGWQLIESLSSFDWSLVACLLIVYALLTGTGERLSQRLQAHWACKAGGL